MMSLPKLVPNYYSQFFMLPIILQHNLQRPNIDSLAVAIHVLRDSESGTFYFFKITPTPCF